MRNACRCAVVWSAGGQRRAVWHAVAVDASPYSCFYGFSLSRAPFIFSNQQSVGTLGEIVYPDRGPTINFCGCPSSHQQKGELSGTTCTTTLPLPTVAENELSAASSSRGRGLTPP